MTLQALIDQMPQSIANAPPEQLTAMMAQLAACQSAVAARLLNGQNSAAHEKTASGENHSLLTIEQVALHLNVPKSYAYELARAHKLQAVRIGKYVRVAPDILAHYVATLAASSQLDIMPNFVKRKK